MLYFPCLEKMADEKVPDWLTADFLKTCLEADKEDFPDSITITNHTVESAVAAGNNYGSLMLRVKINYQKKFNSNSDNKEHVVSLIVKAPLTTGYIDQFSEVMPDFYQIEPRFYGKYIVETYKLLHHDTVPKHFPSPHPQCVVLEDLKVSGYVMVDRQKLLDFDHCQLYIKASAKLHALSVAVNKANPEIVQLLVKQNPDMEKVMEKMYTGMLTNSMRCMAACLEDKPDCKEYYETITAFIESDKCWSTFMEMEKSDVPLKALIQSDPWCTNMMFKYDSSGKVENIKLLDFQGLKFTSPVAEFITFLWVSVNPEVRETRINELYHLYCDSLNSCLEELGCSERLPFDVFKQEVKRLSPLALMILCMMMPLCVSEDAADLNDYFKEKSTEVPIKDSPIYKLYKGPTFEKYCQQSLKQAAREGIFEYIKGKIN